jgi:macrolide transport system ATP-binding/permease protein
MLLTIHNLSKSYGYQTVLKDVSLTLDAGQRGGLVGANGAGKSTLLKIIVGEVEADSGAVNIGHSVELGYLAQTIPFAGDKTLGDLITESTSHIRQLEARMRQLETRMTPANADLDTIMAEYGEVSDQFERRGGYDLDYRIDVVLNGLNVGHLPRDRRFETLSGGEKARVGLAMLLLNAPDVLLLDEPTNHLDSRSLNWLENYLAVYRGGVLIVSHDRYFLNRTVNVILEIDEHTRTIKRYSGDYDAYRTAKTLERRQWEQSYVRQQEEIKALRLEIKETARRNDNYRAHKDNDKLVRNGKRATHQATVSKRVNVAEEKLKRIEAHPIPEPPDELRFNPEFDPQALRGRLPLMVSGLGKSYGQKNILENITFAVHPRDRLAIVGPNGAGKSTLVRILMGEESADAGEIYWNSGINIGYLDQEQRALNLSLSLFEAYHDGLPLTDQQLKAMLLKSGLFRYEEFEKKVGELSSGQQRKLQIARLIAGRANFLILDEPTNHVSFDVLEGLEAALRDFPGPIIAVTHDRRFLEQFDGEILELRDGQFIHYQDYLIYAQAQANLMC